VDRDSYPGEAGQHANRYSRTVGSRRFGHRIGTSCCRCYWRKPSSISHSAYDSLSSHASPPEISFKLLILHCPGPSHRHMDKQSQLSGQCHFCRAHLGREFEGERLHSSYSPGLKDPFASARISSTAFLPPIIPEQGSLELPHRKTDILLGIPNCIGPLTHPGNLCNYRDENITSGCTQTVLSRKSIG